MAAARAQLTGGGGIGESAKHRTVRTTAGLWAKPFHSDALGINPDQREQAIEQLRKHGCTADYDDQGRLIATSQKQYDQVAKIAGLKTGRDGYDHIKSGRDNARGQEEFRRAVERGDYD
jgi:hypothetical protein